MKQLACGTKILDATGTLVLDFWAGNTCISVQGFVAIRVRMTLPTK